MTLPPRRLLDTPPGASADAQLLARHLQAVPEPAPLSEVAVQRIARGLQSAARPWWAGRPVLWLLVIGAPLALAGAWSLRAGRSAPSAVTPSSSQTPSASVLPSATEVPQTAAPNTETSRVTAEPIASPQSTRKVVEPKRSRRIAQPAAPASSEPTPPVVVAPSAPMVAMVAPAPDPLVEESRLLRSALHQLRALRDGQSALAQLQQYDARFPQGQLRAEATLAKVDSLLLLRRPAEALQQLQGLSGSERARLPRGRELRVLEVELQAELGRCDQALDRLEHFSDQDPLLAERALFVRATCAARSQRVDQARSLYEELLRQYPTGAHAAEARRALGKTP